MKNLVYVTQNKNKLEVASKLLPYFEIQNIDFEVPEIQSLDPHEIVKYKLEYAYEKLGKACFVTDDSFYIEALNDFPGPFIRWYYQTVGPEKTCEIVKLFGQTGCKSKSILGYFDGKKTHFFEETIEGDISPEPRGTNGFTWDPIFIPKGESRTFAEMTFEEKHQFTVTGKLLERFSKFLK